MKRVPILCTALFGAVAVAQDKVDLRIQDSQKSLRYTIESSTKSVSVRATTVDGEPMEGRGPTGPTNSARSQKVVFDEGRAEQGLWRNYVAAKATVERPDETGGVDKQELEGGLTGQRVFLVEDDRGVVAHLGSPDGEELPRAAARGIPGKTSFAGITPSEPVAVGAEFELGAKFLSSLKSLGQPVTPAMNADQRGGGNAPEGGGRRRPGAEGGQPPEGGGRRRPGAGEPGQPQGGEPQGGGGERRPGRGQGGAGGQGGGQGGAGGAGGFGRMGGGFGGGSNVVGLLTNDRLEGKVMAKLVGVENGIAKLSFSGKRGAEGSIQDLGLAQGLFGGGRGGRGGQGGGGGGQMPDGDGAAELELGGELWIDVASHQLVKLVLEGKSKVKTSMEMDRGGQVMGIESSNDDTFRYAVQVENAPEQGTDKK